MIGELQAHHQRLASLRLQDLCATRRTLHDPHSDGAHTGGAPLDTNPNAAGIRWQLEVDGLFADFSRQHLDAVTVQAACQWMQQIELPAAARDLANGARLNASEQRAALHTALRASTAEMPADLSAELTATRQQFLQLADALHQGQVRAADGGAISDLVAIGIGGSRLGPELVANSLPADGAVRVHFLSNPDPDSVARLCAELDPVRTAVNVTSKSFTTAETRLLMARLLAWREPVAERAGPLYAVTANRDAALAAGVTRQQILPMWDFVGGRFSVWSCAGFPAAVSCGSAAFNDLLGGARCMDQHFLTAPIPANLPMLLGFMDVWQRSFRGHAGLAVVPYSDRLKLLPAWLQQLWMESNGKRCTNDGQPVVLDTAGIVFGGTGADVQHSFFQALHQGTQVIPAELLGVVGNGADHDALLASMIGQAEALLNGSDRSDLPPERRFPGGRPSTILLIDQLDAHHLGLLLAAYEHRAFVQARLWDVNPFDQFGVELGKQLAIDAGAQLASNMAAQAPDTLAVIGHIHRRRRRD